MANVKFKSFSSGSCGNCYFLGLFSEDGRCEAGILIDAGVSPRQVKKKLAVDGLGFDDFQAMLITHNHYDHVRSLGSHCKHIGKPVWTTPTLHRVLSGHLGTDSDLGSFKREMTEGWNDIVPGRIRARYFEVPHDAAQTVGYAICLDDYKFVIMTDIGEMTPEALAYARNADTVVIESNYDIGMLMTGPYPYDLKMRICKGAGHLSNDKCAEAVRQFMHDGLKYIFLCHLSENNNTPELAYSATREVIGEDSGVSLRTLPRQTASPLFIL